jgi:hypothetical protein
MSTYIYLYIFPTSLHTQPMGPNTHMTLTFQKKVLISFLLKKLILLVKGVLLTYLGEDVGKLRGRRDVEGMTATRLRMKWRSSQHVWCVDAERVDGEVDRADVVVDLGGPRQCAVQLHKQLTKPARPHHAVGHDALLRLSVRTGDDILAI